MPGNVHHRMVRARADVRPAALWCAPRCPADRAPPRRICDAAGNQVAMSLRSDEPVENERPTETLGVGPVTSLVDESGEGTIGDSGRIDIECADIDIADRTLAICRTGARP